MAGSSSWAVQRLTPQVLFETYIQDAKLEIIQLTGIFCGTEWIKVLKLNTNFLNELKTFSTGFFLKKGCESTLLPPIEIDAGQILL
jgi:hypothetical protein